MKPISETWKVLQGPLLIIPFLRCISLISASFVQTEVILLSLEWGILLHTPFSEEKGTSHPAPLYIQVSACACQGAAPELRMEPFREKELHQCQVHHLSWFRLFQTLLVQPFYCKLQ